MPTKARPTAEGALQNRYFIWRYDFDFRGLAACANAFRKLTGQEFTTQAIRDYLKATHGMDDEQILAFTPATLVARLRRDLEGPKGLPGRPEKATTKQRAEFVAKKRKPGISWARLYEMYCKRYPNDVYSRRNRDGCTLDKLRRAHRRVYIDVYERKLPLPS